MAEEDSDVLVQCIRFIKQYTQIVLITAASLTIIAFILLLVYRNPTLVNMEKEVDYTDCIKFNIDPPNELCWDYIQRTNNVCSCKLLFNLTEPLEGNIIMYYELVSYDQTAKDYIISRDDNQLKGVATTPSENCEPFRYDNSSGSNKPIVPCGKIADSMFTDKFALLLRDPLVHVELFPYGMLSAADKEGFKNPDNLESAFRNFTKPKSWKKNIWELDTTNVGNNGFENEAFIAWMRTDWKRKPLYRINQLIAFQNALPPGAYQLDITYSYPVDQYDGRRKVIFVATQTKSNDCLYALGAVFLSIGLLTFLVAASPYIRQYILDKRNANKAPEMRQEGTNPSNTNNPRETPLLTNERSSGDNNGRTHTSI